MRIFNGCHPELVEGSLSFPTAASEPERVYTAFLSRYRSEMAGPNVEIILGDPKSNHSGGE
jgi:hypothetical protein